MRLPHKRDPVPRRDDTRYVTGTIRLLKIWVSVLSVAVVALVILVVFAFSKSSTDATNARSAAKSAQNATLLIQQGRQAGSEANCAILSAVTDSGRQTISSSSLGETPLTRFLEKHGYPPLAVRRAAARQAGQRYVQRIDTSIARTVHAPHSSKLVRHNGSIDCNVLYRVSKLPVQHVSRRPSP